MKPKIALFHPWIKSRGGAEKIILELMKIKEIQFDLYTWIYEKDNTFEEFKNYKINIVGKKFFRRFARTNFLRGIFFINSLFSNIPLEKYDAFLVSTSGVAEFIFFKNSKAGKNYAYVHTPLRDADDEIMNWNFKNRYKNPIKKIIYKIAVSLYKTLEKSAWKKINFAIFNSNLTLERAKKRNLIDSKKSKVIYFPPEIKLEEIKSANGQYFLYPSRINTPKRQDILIEAWKMFSMKHPNEKLVIAGSLENKKFYGKLLKLSKGEKNIKIITNLNNKEFSKMYQNSKAIIFVPYIEDYGIVPFEALAYGKSLIAVNKGGYVDLIKNVQQYYPIKEDINENKLIENINQTLETFMKSKIKPKRIILNNLNMQNYKKEIIDVLK